MSGNKPDLRRAASYVLSAFAGAVCTGIFLTFSAWMMYTFRLPLSAARVLSLFSLGAGCMLSGFICGSIKQRGGLRCGFNCAVIILSVCLLASLIRGTASGTDAIAKVITSVVTGCAGGVFGVNVRR